MPILSAAALLAAMVLWQPPAASRRLRSQAPTRRPDSRIGLVPGLVTAVLGAVAVGWVVDSARGAVLGLALGASASVAVWTLAHAAGASRRNHTRDEVARGCSELAALLRAGHAPVRALQLVADGLPVFSEPAAYAFVGGDLIAALQRVAEHPGCHDLRGLAGAWRIAERTGASMTSSLDDLAVQLSAERELRRTVDTELAASRLTGRLLGFLPVVGLGLGYVVGGDPVGYLLGSVAGLACLGVGISLAVAGVVWTEKLADRAGELP